MPEIPTDVLTAARAAYDTALRSEPCELDVPFEVYVASLAIMAEREPRSPPLRSER